MDNRKNTLTGKVAIITGASSGIGEATAYRLAREGMHLTLLARRQERLNRVAETIGNQPSLGGETRERVLVYPADVRDRDALHQMVEMTLEKWGRVDILVNNAGFGYRSPVVDMDPLRLREILDVNVLAVIESTQAVLPVMIKQSSGHIINMASLAGFIGLPKSSAYSTTKYAVVGFTDGLYREVKRYGIRVTAFCPGFVATEFSPRLKKIQDRQPDAPRLPGVMSSSYVAERIVRVIRRPRRRVTLPPGWWLAVWIGQNFPFLADYALSLGIF